MGHILSPIFIKTRYYHIYQETLSDTDDRSIQLTNFHIWLTVSRFHPSPAAHRKPRSLPQTRHRCRCYPACIHLPSLAHTVWHGAADRWDCHWELGTRVLQQPRLTCAVRRGGYSVLDLWRHCVSGWKEKNMNNVNQNTQIIRLIIERTCVYSVHA